MSESAFWQKRELGLALNLMKCVSLKMMKPLRKAIIRKSYLENLYLKKKRRTLPKKLQETKKNLQQTLQKGDKYLFCV